MGLIANGVGQSSGGNGFTTAAIDTTGANFLAAIVSSSDGTPTVTDSKGNTWASRTVYGASPSVVIWYAINPAVGSGHTLTVTATSKFPSVAWAAFDGRNTSAPYDVENGSGATTTSTTEQPGSITPTADNELVITGLADDDGSRASTAVSGYTVTNSALLIPGTAYGVAMAYAIQTTATATNPTWTWTANTTNARASVASFKAAAGGGTTPSSTDSATLSDSGAKTIGVGGVTQTGSVSESGAVGLGTTDAATLAEQNAIKLAHQDAGTFAEQVSIATATAGQDTAALAEQLQIALAHQDSATLTEALAIALARQDSAALAELVGLALGTADTAAFAEQVSIAVQTAAADTATVGESANATNNGGSSTPTASDSATVAEQITIALQATDGAGLAEQMAVALSRTDTVTLSELVQVAIAIADAASLTDTSAVGAALSMSEAASLAEQAVITLGAPDSANLAEQIRLGLSTADGAALAEQLQIAITSTATDAAALNDVQAIVSALLARADAAAMGDSAQVTQTGPGHGNLLYVLGAPREKWLAHLPGGRWTVGTPQQ